MKRLSLCCIMSMLFAAPASAQTKSEAQAASDFVPILGDVVKELLKNVNAVFVYAQTPDTAESEGGKSTNFVNIEKDVHPKTTHGESHANARSEREVFASNKVKPVAEVIRAEIPKDSGLPPGAAFAWAKANSDTKAVSMPPGVISAELQLKLSIGLTSDSPSVFALSLSDLSDSQYDATLLSRFTSVDFLGVDSSTILSGGLSTLGFSPGTPQTTYASVFAQLNGGVLEVEATDYLGNTLLTASDFSVSTVGGITTATYSGEFSIPVTVESGQTFTQSLEAYTGTAALRIIPEPAGFILAGTGVVGVLFYTVLHRCRAGVQTLSRKPAA